MHYVKAQVGRVIPWDEAFPDYKFGEHGKDKVGFGDRRNSVDNPVAICGEYNTGGRMLEEVGFNAGNRLGFYNIMLVLADKPWAKPDDTDCHIVGFKEYLESHHLGRISGFVNDPAGSENDPQPQEVRDGIIPEVQFVNRTTGHLPHSRYWYHIYYLTDWNDKERPALVLEVNGHTPKTATVFIKPAEISQVGELQFPVNGIMGTWTPDD